MDKTESLANKVKRVCVVDTPFSLFYYLLIYGYNENDQFIMSNNIPKSIRDNLSPIYFPLNELYSYDNIKNILKNLLVFIRLPYEILKLRIKLYSKTKGYTVKSYGHGHLLFSFPLYEYPNSVIIEDGVGNYHELPKFEDYPKIQKLIMTKIFGKHFRKIYDGFGTHPNVETVCLTKAQGYSKYIKDKVVVKKLDDLIHSISESQKNKILKIFNADTVMKNIKETDILLLTEPFTECHELSIDEEIKIYKEIISKYSENRIIIKPHPREKKDYSKYFPNVRVITTPIPLEIFDLMEVKFNKIVTIYSSAALNFKDVEVEFYDGEINNEIVNKQRENVKKQYQELCRE